MKSILSFFLVIIWMIFTVILICTIVGFFVVADEDSGWKELGKKLMENL